MFVFSRRGELVYIVGAVGSAYASIRYQIVFLLILIRGLHKKPRKIDEIFGISSLSFKKTETSCN